MIVVPPHGLLEPANVERLQQSRAFDRRLQGPGSVDVDHQIIVRPDHLAYGLDPRNILSQRQPACLGLERAMALRLELLNFILDFRNGLAIAVIRTGHVIWHRVAIAAEEAIERHVGDLSDSIPARDIDRRKYSDDRLPPPTLFVRNALRG